MRADPTLKIGRIPSKAERQKNPGLDITPWEAEFTTNEDGNVDTGWSQAAFDLYAEKQKEYSKRLSKHEKAVTDFDKAALVHVKAAMEAENGGPTRRRKRPKVEKEKPVLQLVFSDDEDDVDGDSAESTTV
jgi:hypothetical protein